MPFLSLLRKKDERKSEEIANGLLLAVGRANYRLLLVLGRANYRATKKRVQKSLQIN